MRVGPYSRKQLFAIAALTTIVAVLLAYRPVMVPLLITMALLLSGFRPELGADFTGLGVDSPWRVRLQDALPWIPVAMGVGWMLFSAPLPGDDLLRHVNAKQWGFSYPEHFGGHDVTMRWSFWVGFDLAVGTLHGTFGKDVLLTTRIVRALIVLIVGSAVVRAAKVCHGDPLVQFCTSAACILFLLWPRFYLGRPEALFTAIVLAGCFLSRMQWVVIASLLGPAYCLAPIYAVGAVLLGSAGERMSERLIRNGLAGAVVIAITTMFWWQYSAGDLWRVLGVLGHVATSQSEVVGELRPLADALLSVWFVVILGGVVALAWLTRVRIPQENALRALGLVAVSCFFAIPDHARYIPLIFTLLLLASASLVPAVSVTGPTRLVGWTAAIGVAIALLGNRPAVEADRDVLAGLAVDRPGARILAPFNQSLYLATSANPDAILTPIFDFASTRADVREVVAALTHGQLDCAAARRIDRFDYLIENTLQGSPPECLQLVRISGAWRVWAFRESDDGALK